MQRYSKEWCQGILSIVQHECVSKRFCQLSIGLGYEMAREKEIHGKVSSSMLPNPFLIPPV